MSCDEVRRTVDAYVDGELDADSARAVREHVIRCSACRRRIDEREELGLTIRSAPYYSAPERLRARLAERTNRATLASRMFPWAAAAALVVSIAGGITFVRSAAMRGDAIVAAVVDGHVRSLMADHLFDVQSTDQHTVKPWFLGRLDFSPPVVDLAAANFPLVGGRLDYLGGRPVAALVYQRRQHTINMFVSPTDEADVAATAGRSVRGFHVHHWIRDRMSFWAVSDLNDAELSEFVRMLQTS